MVVDVFERIHSENSGFPDTEGLLVSARQELGRMRKVASLYDQALRYVDDGEWQQALECFEEVQQLEPGFRDIVELLSRARLELTPPPTVEVPELSGLEVSQASSALASKGLKLGVRRKFSSDTVPQGQIIRQSPAAGKEVQAGESVSVTVSLGPTVEERPDLAESRDEVGSTEFRQAESLSLGSEAFFDELTRVCAKYAGFGYHVDEAIPRQSLTDSRSRVPIPADERVIALVDNSSMLSRGIGLAICAGGIRWRNYAANPVSKKVHGFLEWSEVADVQVREHQWTAEYGVEMGHESVFVAWKNNAMDQTR